MQKRTTPKILGHAKQLHRNMTPAEVRLWARLRTHRLEGIHFRNQHALGNYVVDFCAPRKKLIIELDGSQHMEQEGSDKERIRIKRLHGSLLLEQRCDEGDRRRDPCYYSGNAA